MMREPAIETEPRTVIPLTHGWRFYRGRVGRRWLRGETSTGEPVSLPHCWNETDTFQIGVPYYRGPGAYRCALPALPAIADPADWVLETGGFYGVGEAFLDGCRLGRLDGQYLGCRISLPPEPAPSSTLALRLTNRCGRHVLPGIPDPDFLLCGGLAGGAMLMCLPHFRMDETTVRIAYSDPLAATLDVHVAATLLNAGTMPRGGRLDIALTGADSEPLAAGSIDLALLAPDARQAWRHTLTLDTPALWSPATPRLHTLTLSLHDTDGRLVDRLRRRIGFRQAEFRPRQGFFLNGQRLEIHGVNRHERIPGFGTALPAELQRQDADWIKAMGCNAVRLAHYPQHPAFLDACDALGLLVYAELASWKSVRTGRWQQAAERQWRAMIERDRHRPSIFIWGMGNESQSRTVYLALRQLATDLDGTRPVTYAENHLYRARRARTLGIPDVWGLNYELEAAAAGCDASRLQNVLVTELANYPLTARGTAEAEREQVRLIQANWATMDGVPSIAGHFLWCYADYATFRKKRYLRYSGVVDAWRLPKRAVALLRARYLPEPFVAAYADWRQDGETPRKLDVFTNAESVEIWSNGERLRVLEGAPYSACELPFTGHPLLLKARHRDGEAVCRIAPWGAPTALHIELPAAAQPLPAGYSLPIDIRVTDAEGHLAADAAGLATVTVSGSARLRAFRPDGLIPFAGGIGRTFITGTGTAGTARIDAQAANLTAASACISFA